MSTPKMVAVPEHQICCCYMAGAKTLPQGCGAQQDAKNLEAKCLALEQRLAMVTEAAKEAEYAISVVADVLPTAKCRLALDAQKSLRAALASTPQEREKP